MKSEKSFLSLVQASAQLLDNIVFSKLIESNCAIAPRLIRSVESIDDSVFKTSLLK